MKALVYEKAHTLDTWAIELTDVAEPTPGESDVLVEVRAVGINPGETFWGRRGVSRLTACCPNIDVC
jgi:NADPH:quinone reductase